LAAPQVGVLKQLLVMDCAAKDAEPEPMALVNPAVTWASEEMRSYEEGCLSIPEVYEDISPAGAGAGGLAGSRRRRHEAEFDGLWAICVQHEIDHLKGRLFIDYLSAVKRTMITAKMRKLKREKARA
jgi:peptide deformylase